MEHLKWSAFKEQLQANPQLILQFRYAENKWVDASYHITEIKQAPITSVDCGGVMNRWTEIIVQLWEPEDQQQERAMEVSKALSIINLVEKTLTLDADGIVKIEFGNQQFDTRQMLPINLLIDGDNLVVDLRPDAVQCKAIDRGGSCGTNDKGEECCTPTAAVKPKIQMQNLAADASCCAPGLGCC
ncbi:DUF6428 family protein [Mucilaginibacter sp. RB4R14]|uniref:DUF6428 family protein n=1 Tax=Mucilaginibacter aurantiaciroseus TaxID=2949308 RepID=UPI0020917B2E|nr:DUF6428 family protein [Mucilaginibacter aurantiaciroseus]MCO5936393.1 DUF6428 family protein [Mucilaginibacter aurantiaciroseus]